MKLNKKRTSRTNRVVEPYRTSIMEKVAAGTIIYLPRDSVKITRIEQLDSRNGSTAKITYTMMTGPFKGKEASEIVHSSDSVDIITSNFSSWVLEMASKVGILCGFFTVITFHL